MLLPNGKPIFFKIYINGSVFSSATVASPFNYALSDAEIQQVYQSN
jgi:hypothetical protein